MQMSYRCRSRQLRPAAWPRDSRPAAQRDAGTATRGWAGVSSVKPSAAPLERWLAGFGGLLEAVPPRPARKPKAQRSLFISSSTCRWLPERNCSNSAALSPPHAHGSFLRAGAAHGGFGLVPSPHRYLCKRLNTANCRSILS